MSFGGTLTRFTQKSFTLPASATGTQHCLPGQHAFAVGKGRCVRCGEKIRQDGFAEVATDSNGTGE